MIRPESEKPARRKFSNLVCTVLILAPFAAIHAATPIQDLELVRQAETLVTSDDSEARKLALFEVTNPALLRELARTEKDMGVRCAAILMLTDQAELQQLATAPEARVREAAVIGITDETFLLGRVGAGSESSPTVREAIVGALRTQDAIVQAAETSYFRDVRTAAVNRVLDHGRAVKVKSTQDAITAQAKGMARGEPAANWVDQTLNSTIDVICQAAAWRVREPADLARVASVSRNRDVLKIVFGRLNDPAMLQKVAAEAAYGPMRLAATRKAGQRSWEDIFNATNSSVSGLSLGDALSAVALFDGVQSEATGAVQRGCKAMIEHGDESLIPEMTDLFALYGDLALGGVFYQSGQPDLVKVAENWAKAMGHNYGMPWKKEDNGR